MIVCHLLSTCQWQLHDLARHRINVDNRLSFRASFDLWIAGLVAPYGVQSAACSAASFRIPVGYFLGGNKKRYIKAFEY